MLERRGTRTRSICPTLKKCGREIGDGKSPINYTKWSLCSKDMSHTVRSTNYMCKKTKMK
jgi:hypothetical protein